MTSYHKLISIDLLLSVIEKKEEDEEEEDEEEEDEEEEQEEEEETEEEEENERDRLHDLERQVKRKWSEYGFFTMTS